MHFDIESEPRRILGVDSTTMEGIDVMTVEMVLAESLGDRTAWELWAPSRFPVEWRPSHPPHPRTTLPSRGECLPQGRAIAVPTLELLGRSFPIPPGQLGRR